ncbi:MAG: FAD-binding protein [Candidatus Solibacter sp.]
MLAPTHPAELADALRCAAADGRTISLMGSSTKKRMGGPVEPADVAITTMSLRGVLQYEPRDLTVSVLAGLSWCEFVNLLAEHRQMVPLDPPYESGATVGGVIAANSSGPRRRLYGTARDLVIGMTFATLEGKLVKSGGMVVKNVAGLDMAKLMIGSFGTLAAIAVVNFKLQPMPEIERSFLLPFESLAAAIVARNAVLRGPLLPSAIDLLNPAAARTLGHSGWLLALRTGGNEAAVRRYETEFAQYGGAQAFEGADQDTLWRHVVNFTKQFLAAHDDGAVVRVSCTLKDSEAVMQAFPGPAIARAGSGVCYGYYEESRAAAQWMKSSVPPECRAVMEFAADEARRSLELWPSPGADLEMMRRVKHLFDPKNLLNRGRLYRII